jgi:hypothetical protein
VTLKQRYFLALVVIPMCIMAGMFAPLVYALVSVAFSDWEKGVRPLDNLSRWQEIERMDDGLTRR